MKTIKKSMLGLAVLAIAVAVVAVPKPSHAAVTLQNGNSLGDSMILSKLFSGDSMLNSMSGGNTLGSLFIMDKLFAQPTITKAVATVTPVVVTTPAVITMADRMEGKILIQTQANGQAWYVNPVSDERVYLGPTPADAFSAMAKEAVGVTNATFASYNGVAPANSNEATSLVGRFIIKPEDSGKLYYVRPSDRTIISVPDASSAMQLIQQEGVGITNANIALITVAP
jgi:hypothetical protein